ncbi:MAG: peroxidase family protein [Planctomycetota bacterium]|nr:peroxidase family protein [Planctomycetota bacterium]MDA1139100.1 peroxidase family protein [Planctomycetota bacterium]
MRSISVFSSNIFSNGLSNSNDLQRNFQLSRSEGGLADNDLDQKGTNQQQQDTLATVTSIVGSGYGTLNLGNVPNLHIVTKQVAGDSTTSNAHNQELGQRAVVDRNNTGISSRSPFANNSGRQNLNSDQNANGNTFNLTRIGDINAGSPTANNILPGDVIAITDQTSATATTNNFGGQSADQDAEVKPQFALIEPNDPALNNLDQNAVAGKATNSNNTTVIEIGPGGRQDPFNVGVGPTFMQASRSFSGAQSNNFNGQALDQRATANSGFSNEFARNNAKSVQSNFSDNGSLNIVDTTFVSNQAADFVGKMTDHASRAQDTNEQQQQGSQSAAASAPGNKASNNGIANQVNLQRGSAVMTAGMFVAQGTSDLLNISSDGLSFLNTRSIDGATNNFFAPTTGMADTQLGRVGPAAYSDLVEEPGGTYRPSARLISNVILAQEESIPNARNLSNMIWQWGQFLDHDIDLTPGHEPAELFPIIVPNGDVHFDPFNEGGKIIPLTRSTYDESTGTDPSNPRQQLNKITSWIDASNVYGSDEERSDALRTFDGGKLKVSAGNLLPFNEGGLDNAGGPGANLFLAGDVRANEQTGLTAIHTLFVREHNRLADEIAAQHPAFSDEQIYQKARKIVGAYLQNITYSEFLPALLGADALPDYHGYNPDLDGAIVNEFSTALYRLGHSMLTSELLRLDENGNEIPEGSLALRDAFFNPSRIIDEGGIDPVLRGLVGQQMEEVDTKLIDDVRNFLFGPPGAGGFDLGALNIQRGRDHGLPDYNTMRVAYGLAPVNSFSDITSDSELAQKLEETYGDVSNIDLWVGALAEDHVPGSSLGQLLQVAMIDQFVRLRDGDRFYFENDSSLTAAEKNMIRNTDLSDIIRNNTDADNIQQNVFFVH